MRESFHRRSLLPAVTALLTGLVVAAAGCSGPGALGPGPSPDQGSTAAAPTADDAAHGTPRPLGWGPDQRDADAAAVAGMSLEQKAGQVLLPFFPGLDAEAHARTVERLHLAGSIVMGDNVPATANGQVDTAA